MLCLLIVLGACGETRQKSVENKVAELAGEWKTPCDSQSTQYTLSFTQEQLVYSWRTYLNPGCGDEAYREVLVTYTVVASGEQVASLAGAKTLDLKLVSMVASSNDDSLTQVLNGMSFCGMHDWQTHEPRDVAGLDCGAGKLEDVGSTDFTIYTMNQNQLTLGEYTADHNRIGGPSDADRAIVLSKDLIFSR